MKQNKKTSKKTTQTQKLRKLICVVVHVMWGPTVNYIILQEDDAMRHEAWRGDANNVQKYGV